MEKKKTPRTYYNTNHGLEIYPARIRMTDSEKKWRQKATSFILEQIQKSKDVEGLTDQKKIRNQLTKILFTLRVINQILKVQYSSPNWENHKNVIDELIYILLTRRSKIEDAQNQFETLRKNYLTWDEVRLSPPEDIKTLIMGGGLEDEKVKSIQTTLEYINENFGRIDNNDFSSMTDTELEQFLLKLPGIGPKSSACILMYARDVDIFPADTHCIRIINRLGLFTSFGFEWEQDNHKQAEKDLLILIPPHMRSDLHRNLVALGRNICKTKPLCNKCELRKFCGYYRNKQQEKHRQIDNTPVVIDMFSGAGGFSLGLKRAGFKVIAAVDNGIDAIRTYRLNHPEIPDEAIIEGDAREVEAQTLRSIIGERRLDLLVGGPPCQGFSMMGNRVPHKFKNGDKKFGADYEFAEDERNHLFETIVDIAYELKARYVVIENVPGLGSAEIEEKTYAEHITDKLTEIHYQVEIVRLEASEIGVPQKRHRYFIIGVHPDEKIPDFEKIKTVLPEEERPKLRDALFDLPGLTVSDGKWITDHSTYENRELYEPYLDRFNIRDNTCILFNHISRYNNPDDVELYSNLQQGETYYQLVERLTGPDGKKPKFAKYSTRNFHDKYYRLEWDGYSKTIVSHLHKDGNSFVHPEQARSLSVREAARIQSFPDDYIFCGSRGPQFIQIGNAVPPVMAERIGRGLIEVMKQKR